MARLEQVLPALRAGKRVRNKQWKNKEYWIQEQKYFYETESLQEEFEASAKDLLSDDWEVVGEENPIREAMSKEVFIKKSDEQIQKQKDLRAQAAMAAIGGVLSNPALITFEKDKLELRFLTSIEEVAKTSILFADALLKKLEEE